MSPPPTDDIPPNAIDHAPDLPDEVGQAGLGGDDYVWQLVTDLQVENGRLEAENARLSAKVDIEEEKARLIQPYANKVFLFLSSYCACVLVLILLSGFKLFGFELKDTVLSIIAGSTAVAAIGLVGIIVTGLFSPRK